ncbi:MAG TPA: hypothetical protein IAC04_06985 [Candidatus Coprenecus stercoravium]|uniref:Outer membrane protein beta-barrel domain-containing protein n=1 Tax=Candidatus Coprenecus stercoravium TaxID=2840735 RepID=A0A9D2GS27_9BACT|nr:hypothetical protein [Candidatus Coprenecus stercoravium]
MRRRILYIAVSAVLLTILSGSIADTSARTRPEFHFQRGSELRLTWGVVPLDAVTMASSFSSEPYPHYYDTRTIADVMTDGRCYGGDGYLTGAVGLTYTYRFRKWFELSGVLTYSGYCRDFFDKYTDKFAYRYTDTQISLMPYVRFVWVHTNLVRLYSGLGLGISMEFDGDDYQLLPAFAVTPVGITVGTYIYGIAELSLGNTGLFSIGLGYKF